MSKLKEYNGHFCESEYEYAFIAFLEREGWQYLQGNKINRQTRKDVLYSNDLERFLTGTNPDLLPDEIHSIIDSVRLVGAENDFATLHKVYGWMIDGVQFTPQSGTPRMVALIDYENPGNTFSAVSTSLLWSMSITDKNKPVGRTCFCLSMGFRSV